MAPDMVKDSRIIPSDRPLQGKQQSDSGLDNVLLHKYQAMTDSHLLMMLKGDISGQSEKSLSMALAELERRTEIDWREMAIVKTRGRRSDYCGPSIWIFYLCSHRHQTKYSGRLDDRTGGASCKSRRHYGRRRGDRSLMGLQLHEQFS